MMKRRMTIIALGVLILFALLPGMNTQADFGTNWTGMFYNTVDLTGAVIDTGTYPNGLNENWGTGSPVDTGAGRVMTTVNPDGFSARFTSTQTFLDGQYEFFVTFEAGARMYIDGVTVLDEFTPRALTTMSFMYTLSAGNHQLVVEYMDDAAADTSGAIIQVQWFLGGSGGGTEPTPTSVPVTTVSVHTVRGLSVRTGPYLGASYITVARPGASYPVSAKNTSEGIYTWYLITVGEQTGWSSGRYLTVNGDPASIPAQNTIFDEIDGAPDVGVIAAPRAVMNFRIRPSIRTARIGQVGWGEEVVLIGRTVQGSRNWWYQVRRADGMVGWIYAPFISVRGPLDAVPIR